ncbi:hypothetical protein TWF281_010812 [Arthrobotrys megalospora]
MCYHIKTYRCGHYKRTFSGCKCTLHSSGEQRQPTFCDQWFCNKRPYYSDGSCERDHITNINIGHHFNPETGRRSRYRPGQRLRSLRPPRNNGATTSAPSGILAIQSSRLPTELLEQLSIHPDELDLENDYSMDWDDDDQIPPGSRVLEFGIGIPSTATAEEFFSTMPRAFTVAAPPPPQGGYSPAEFINTIAQEISERARGDVDIVESLHNTLRRMRERSAHTLPPHLNGPSTTRRPTATTGRPIRINVPTTRPVRPPRPSMRSPSTALPTLNDLLMEIPSGADGTSAEAAGRANGGEDQQAGPSTGPGAGNGAGNTGEGST